MDDRNFRATVFVSADGKDVRIEHKFDADWNTVLRVHEALRDWAIERISGHEVCPYRPDGARPASLPPVASEKDRRTRQLEAALRMAHDLIETIQQTSGNVWFVKADDPETAVCDTFETIQSALAGAGDDPVAVEREAAVHHIKCWPNVFEEMRAGRKTAEYRINDRGYRVGDGLLIREWCPTSKAYTHREIERTITHVLAEGFGMPAGYAMLSLAAAIRSGESAR